MECFGGNFGYWRCFQSFALNFSHVVSQPIWRCIGRLGVEQESLQVSVCVNLSVRQGGMLSGRLLRSVLQLTTRKWNFARWTCKFGFEGWVARFGWLAFCGQHFAFRKVQFGGINFCRLSYRLSCRSGRFCKSRAEACFDGCKPTAHEVLYAWKGWCFKIW